MNLSVVLFLESLGGGEVMVILLFILMFFGSEKIPGIAKGLGKGIREVKDAMNGVQDELKGGLREAEKEINKIKGDVTKDLPDTNASDVWPKTINTCRRGQCSRRLLVFLQW